MKKAYAYHKPTPEALEKVRIIREACSALDDTFDEQCPKSRELAIAKTHLEIASRFAITAIIHNDPNSVIME